jgi:hypothetical protein
MTTLDNVLRAIDAIPHTNRKPYKDGFKFNNPFDSSSDSHSFCLFDIRNDGEGATYKYFAGNEIVNHGTLYDLAKRLGAKIEGAQRHKIASTKRKYDGLADYAKAHGLPSDALLKAGWSEDTKYNRPALRFVTQGGTRWRFLDNQDPRYLNEALPEEEKFLITWYGLKRAIYIANKENLDYIVLCNGEISTLAGQYYGVPTFARASGENKLPDGLLAELNGKWSGRVIIALDCDETGQSTSKEIQAQLSGNGVIVDLNLSDGGDVADFCMLNTSDSRDNLMRLVNKQNPTQELSGHHTDTHQDDRVRSNLGAMMRGEQPSNVMSFPHPITSLHQFGGFIRLCVGGKVTLIAGGTGTGKTQFLETMVESLVKLGSSGLWFGTEFNETEMEMRRIQRYTGRDGLPHITMEMIYDHLAYLSNKEKGMPDSKNWGVRLTSTQLDAYEDAKDFLNKAYGRIEYFGGKDSLDETFADMDIAIERMTRNNRKPMYVIFDYVQLLRVKSPDSSVNRYEYAFEMVKQFAERHNIHVFMTSQVNKASQAGNQKREKMGVGDAHFIRGDKANLFLILDRQFREVDGEFIETTAFYLQVVKSSLGGKPLGYDEPVVRIPMIMDYPHLQFIHGMKGDWRQHPAYEYLPDNIYYQGM